ncbi:N-acetyl sugar amidotransferase [Thalassotalea euphylliae]|uniref:N-acetyl sugar amidotransferase n=1 Tax=Thalassotalea euphylliae TaxID=1655234 RepID=A0A3E0UDM4_9GAMM|nr:N-acetyl sugar amidotransferase [Thalassotalea euphylliae]REL34814.1 N-acetyl sugar amidotransferase [Thalassotalea euphylliae]
MQKCTACNLPETYETIEFDENGVCNICRQKDYKDEKINWEKRAQMLAELVEKHRGKYEYDCIVPFSGGKDSTYTLWYLVKKFKVRPLVVQFNHGFMRDTLMENNRRTFKKLGVDVISFTPNWKLVKRLMLETLVRKGDFCWHCHTGIFAYPMHIALKYQVPLIFWGEPSSEYTAYYDYEDEEIECVDETRFNRFINLGITAEDMYGMIKDDYQCDPRELSPYTYPPLRDLKRLKYQSVCLGSFIPWDVKANTKIIQEELGWRGDQVEGMPWDEYSYEKIECSMQGMRDYIKYLKRGYSRVSQMVALDLRNERISKEYGDKLVAEYEGRKPPSLTLFLEYLGISEDQFNHIVAKTVVPPFKPDFDNMEYAPKTHDFDRWYREDEQDQGIIYKAKVE